MSDKRRKTRFLKRLRVRFGHPDADKMAYTGDLSEDGMFIRSVVAKFVHGQMQIEITTPDEERIVLEGKVRWAKRVPPHLIHKYPRAGFGLRIAKFHSGKAEWQKLIKSLEAGRED